MSECQGRKILYRDLVCSMRCTHTSADLKHDCIQHIKGGEDAEVTVVAVHSQMHYIQQSCGRYFFTVYLQELLVLHHLTPFQGRCEKQENTFHAYSEIKTIQYPGDK